MKRAAVCTIGDEILIGQIVDTNSSYIARELNAIGVKVDRMVSIQDDGKDIKESLKSLLQSFDIVVVTGGLGPTKDDMTKAVLKEISDSDSYVRHAGQYEVVKRILSARGVELSDINRDQALVPSKADVIVNRQGTAPCIVLRFSGEQYAHTPTLYAMPGVPFETIALLPEVMQDIRRHYSLEDIHHKTIITFGIPESTLAKKIEAWEDALPDDMKLAYLPNALSGVKLRLSIYGGNKEDETRRIEEEFSKLRPLLKEAIYTEEDDTLYGVIGKFLTGNRKTLSVAESCTGGRIASLFTSVPGASSYFYGSVTSYDNSVKHNILGVSNEILTSKGAVSKECAEAMALGVKKALQTDYAISTTGIAGPDGGTPDKPVGTIWVGIAYDDAATGKPVARSCRFQFTSNRITNIDRFSSNALNFFREQLISEPRA